MNLTLSADDAAALEARTEGWAVGLQMAGLAMQGLGTERIARFVTAFTGSQRYILDYFTNVVSGTTEFTYATPESQDISPEALQELEEIVRGYVEEDKVIGAELMVLKNRRIVLHEAFGWRDRDDERTMRRDTLFNIRPTREVTNWSLTDLVLAKTAKSECTIFKNAIGAINPLAASKIKRPP